MAPSQFYDEIEVAIQESVFGGNRQIKSEYDPSEFMDIDEQPQQFTMGVRFGRVPKGEKEKINQMMMAKNKELQDSFLPSMDISDEDLVDVIRRSHIETSRVTKDNVSNVLANLDESRVVESSQSHKICPLDPYVGNDDFQQKFSPMVREVVAFAKDIPSFHEIRHEDKITLLRTCIFEVLLIRYSVLIDTSNKRMFSLSGSVIYTHIYRQMEASSNLADSILKFIEQLNTITLSETETALFTAAIVINPKRDGLHDVPKITALHRRLVNCLHTVMRRERPNMPHVVHTLMTSFNDLFTLNDMHTNHAQNVRRGCPMQSETNMMYDEKRLENDEGLPTSPSTSYSQDYHLQSPGSADSGFSLDDAIYDSSNSLNNFSNDRSKHYSKPQENLTNDSSYRNKAVPKEKILSSWHKPHHEAEKTTDSPVLRRCLEAPSNLKMDSFNEYYRGTHTHKKFRRHTAAIESLDSRTSSPHSSISPTPSFGDLSPSSIASSPSRVSSSPYSSSTLSSSPSSPASSMSILAHRLAMPVRKFPKSSPLLESLKQEPKFGGPSKALISDTLHDCIMNGQSKVPRNHTRSSAPRFDNSRSSSPQSFCMSVSPSRMSPYGYTSPPNGYIPSAHSPLAQTPTGLGGSAMSGCHSPNIYMCEDLQPLNLSTKTPPPAHAVALMEV